jgi:hypothetical protein
MSLGLLIYLADVIDGIKVLLTVLIGLGILGFILTFAVHDKNKSAQENTPAIKAACFSLLFILICSILQIFLPNSKVIYKIEEVSNHESN